MNELSKDIKTHVAIVRKDKEEVLVVPITEEKMFQIVADSNAKKTHITLDGSMYYTRDITVEKMSPEYQQKLSGNVIDYTEDKLIGRKRETGESVYRLERFQEVLRRKSQGGNIVKSLGILYGYFKEGKITYVKREEIII